MPRLGCTYRQFLEIIDAHGFVLVRHGATSHRRYRGTVNGEVRLVDLSPHSWSDEVPLGTLNATIRQSGLSKRLFQR